MIVRRSVGALLAVFLVCVAAAGPVAAVPPSPGGSDTPPDHDPCENVGKYLNTDYDQDGLSGYQECQLGTDPQEKDTDYDKLYDFDELWIGTNPTMQDTDSDGATDCWEHVYQSWGWPTDPLIPGEDWDVDGVADELESYSGYGLDPGMADTDQDMMLDGEDVGTQACYGDHQDFEPYAAWASAVNPDCDGDGLLDGIEVKSFHTYQYDPDTDGDGYSDGDEVLKWGTDPLDWYDHPSTRNPPDYHP